MRVMMLMRMGRKPLYSSLDKRHAWFRATFVERAGQALGRRLPFD